MKALEVGAAACPSTRASLLAAHNRLWTRAAVLLGVALFVGQCFSGVLPQDEGGLLTYPWLIARGAVPYRDVRMMYPPGTYLMLAALFKLGVPGLVAERALGVGARLVYLVIVNRLASGSWRAMCWTATPLAYCLLFFASTDMRAYPWIVAMPLLAAGFALIERQTVLSGTLFVACGLVRFELAVSGGAAMLLYGLASPREQRWRNAWAGLGVIAALAAIYLALDLVTAGRAVQDIVLDPILRIGPSRRLPFWPPAGGILGVPIEALTLAAPPCVALAALRLRDPAVAATNAALILALPYFLNTADLSHLLGAAALVVPWAGLSAQRLARDSHPAGLAAGLSAAHVLLRGLTAWYLALLLAFSVLLAPLSPLSAAFVGHLSDRAVAAGSRSLLTETPLEARADNQVIAFLRRHARQGDSVFITPAALPSLYTMTDLYYAIGLRPASRYLEMEHGVEDRVAVQREIMANLNRRTWIVRIRGGDWYWVPAGTRPTGAPLDRAIGAGYHPVMSNPTYQILSAR